MFPLRMVGKGGGEMKAEQQGCLGIYSECGKAGAFSRKKIFVESFLNIENILLVVAGK